MSKLITFDQVVPFVEDFLGVLRRRGLAGNIVRDAPGQMVGEVRASWTGEKYQLVLVGNPTSYQVQLRKMKDGNWTVTRFVRDSRIDHLHLLLIDFSVLEG